MLSKIRCSSVPLHLGIASFKLFRQRNFFESYISLYHLPCPALSTWFKLEILLLNSIAEIPYNAVIWINLGYS